VIDGFCGEEIYGKKIDYGRKRANVSKSNWDRSGKIEGSVTKWINFSR